MLLTERVLQAASFPPRTRDSRLDKLKFDSHQLWQLLTVEGFLPHNMIGYERLCLICRVSCILILASVVNFYSACLCSNDDSSLLYIAQVQSFFVITLGL
jgi:hypothetical protein